MVEVTEVPAAARRAGRSSASQESLEEQVARLQDDIRSIAASLAKLSDEKVSEARSTAKSQYRTLVKSGQHVVDDLSDQVNAYEGQLVDTIREKPLTAVAGAIGIGFLIAVLSRR
ncbi:MAG TPA: DNA gyrase subunit B [Devosiaceae bacterium]|nr:DNA gyrase subunit B [Devosiaceae bacterium]